MAHGSFDLVLTDQAMPKMTGAELAERVASAHPGLPVILATGFAERQDAGRGLFAAQLGKPFDQDVLGEAIRTAVPD